MSDFSDDSPVKTKKPAAAAKKPAAAAPPNRKRLLTKKQAEEKQASEDNSDGPTPAPKKVRLTPYAECLCRASPHAR